MDFETMTCEEVSTMDIETLADLNTEAESSLTDAELDVYDAIAEHIEDFPLEFFQKSCEELNQAFGAHDDVTVTGNVRKALFWLKASLGMIDAVTDMLNEICDDAGIEDED